MRIIFYHKVPETIINIFSDVLGNDNEIIRVSSSPEIMEEYIREGADLVIIGMPDREQAVEELIGNIKNTSPKTKIIIYGLDDTSLVIRYMRYGVDFCFTENVPKNQLREYIKRSLLQDSFSVNRNMHKYRWFVGESKSIRELKENLSIAINSNKNILILGPRGTGKLNIARLIHECSVNRNLQFKTVSLNSYDQQYLETQFWMTFNNLFQEIDSDLDGVREPICGTIYVEQLETQEPDFVSSFINIIKAKQAGLQDGNRTLSLPRIIISLEDDTQLPEKYSFLRDKFYILNLPTLLERKEDLPLLIYSIIEKYASKHNRLISNISLDAFIMLINYSWPGNIFELQSVIENAVLLTLNNNIGIRDIGITPEMLFQGSRQDILGKYIPLKLSVEKFEKSLINAVMETSDNDQEKAAMFLGLNKAELSNKMKLFSLA